MNSENFHTWHNHILTYLLNIFGVYEFLTLGSEKEEFYFNNVKVQLNNDLKFYLLRQIEEFEIIYFCLENLAK